MPKLAAREAAELIRAGRAPADVTTGILDLGMAALKQPVVLPAGLHCYSLSLTGQPLTALPPGLVVDFKLDLTDCQQIAELPPDLAVNSLILTNCTRLESLPAGLRVNFLRLDGSTALRDWPEDAHVVHGSVRARGCTALRRIPASLGPLSSLDLRGCHRIDQLPPAIRIASWVDIGGTKITRLPESCNGVGLRWRGVPVTPQIAFAPETLSGAGILAERNVELRRVMIERLGFEKFLREVSAKVIDEDRDPGGKRQLLRVLLPEDEPIVVVSVFCPSTGRQYLVRVPPTMKSCRQAVAWTAGFDDPDDYAPLVET